MQWCRQESWGQSRGTRGLGSACMLEIAETGVRHVLDVEGEGEEPQMTRAVGRMEWPYVRVGKTASRAGVHGKGKPQSVL